MARANSILSVSYFFQLHTHTLCGESGESANRSHNLMIDTFSRLRENPTKFTGQNEAADVSYNRVGVNVDYINPRGF